MLLKLYVPLIEICLSSHAEELWSQLEILLKVVLRYLLRQGQSRLVVVALKRRVGTSLRLLLLHSLVFRVLPIHPLYFAYVGLELIQIGLGKDGPLERRLKVIEILAVDVVFDVGEERARWVIHDWGQALDPF